MSQVEWVFEAHDDEAKQVDPENLTPKGESWLSWLDPAQTAPKAAGPSKKAWSRDSEMSAAPLPEETASPAQSRDRDRFGFSRDLDTAAAGTQGDAASRPPEPQESDDRQARMGSRDSQGFLKNMASGLPTWLGGASAEETPLPPPMPSRLDPDDGDPILPPEAQNSILASDFEFEEIMEEVTRERGFSANTVQPPASSMVTSREAWNGEEVPTGQAPFAISSELDLGRTRGRARLGDEADGAVRKDTADQWLEQFDNADVAAAVAAAAVDLEDILPEPPLPPPAVDPYGEINQEGGFQEIEQAKSEATEEAMPDLIPADEAIDREVAAEEAEEEHADGDEELEPPDGAVAVDVPPTPSGGRKLSAGLQAMAGSGTGMFRAVQNRGMGSGNRLLASLGISRAKPVEDAEGSDEQLDSARRNMEEMEDLMGPTSKRAIAWLSQRVLSRCPCCWVSTMLLLLWGIAAGGLIAFPLDVETDFDSFLKNDVNTSVLRDAFLHALTKKDDSGRRLNIQHGANWLEELFEEPEPEGFFPNSSRRLAGARLYKHSELYFAYEVSENAILDGQYGLLDSQAHLKQIIDFEKELRDAPLWQESCALADPADRGLCETGVSISNYVYPSAETGSRTIVPSKLIFDGGSADMVPAAVSLKLMEVKNAGVKDIILPPDFHFGGQLRMVRSVFRFKWYCCTSADSAAERGTVLEEQGAKWEKLLDELVIPMIRARQRKCNTNCQKSGQGVRIFYSGSGLSNKEVMEFLFGDLMLAGLSMGFVLVYLFVHTSSVLLSIFGLLIIFASIPFSYVMFALMTGVRKMSIASLLSVFLIVGLGSDVVFVYIDFWKDSKQLKLSYASRLTWTLVNAGKASFATSFTTALSFFANLASILKPLREFGFFMGLCVMCCWVQLTLCFLPLCLVDEYWFARCRMRWPCWELMSPYRKLQKIPSEDPDNHPYVNAFTKQLHRWRKTVTILPAIVSMGLMAWAIMVVKVDTGVPNIFPDDHNQNRGKEVFAIFKDLSTVFDPTWRMRDSQVAVCSDSMFRELDASYASGSWAYACNLMWCEAEPDTPKSKEGTCECWRKNVPGNCDDNQVTVIQKFVATRDIEEDEMEGPIRDYLHKSPGVAHPFAMVRFDNLAPLVTEEWERGYKEVRYVTEISAILQRHAESGEEVSTTCGWQDMCFCNSFPCKTPEGWQQVDKKIALPKLNLTAMALEETQRRLEELPTEDEKISLVPSEPGMSLFRRRLQASSEDLSSNDIGPPDDIRIAPARRASIDIVFGIKVTGTSTLLGQMDLESSWHFADNLQAHQPWAQRNLYKFCTSFPKKLRVTERKCWIEDFRRHLTNNDFLFPLVASQFNSVFLNWVEGPQALTGLHSTKEFLWLRNGEVKAAFVAVRVDVDYYAPTEEAIAFSKEWDAYVNQYNAEAHLYANDAWHTSSLWVRAEAQSALISSTITTVVLVVVLAFLGMLVFTRDQKLSLMVVLSTLQVIFGLTWFITVVMDWAIGAIEVIALIVFIGYAVTYSLHIAHRYGAAEGLEWKTAVADDELQKARYKRTAFALASIGGAACGSAVTTVGCSIFLLFCTLTIFQKLGGVVLVVTTMSIFAALIPLPGALLTVGPQFPGNCWCMRPRETFHKMKNVRATMAEMQDKRKQKALEKRAEYERLKKEREEKQAIEKLEKETKSKAEAEEKARKREEEAKRKAEEKDHRVVSAGDSPTAKAKAKPKAKASSSNEHTASSKSGEAPASIVDLDSPRKVPSGSSTGAASSVGSSKNTRSTKLGESKSAVASGVSSKNPALAALKPVAKEAKPASVVGNAFSLGSGLSLPGVSGKTPPSSSTTVSAPRQDSKFSDSDFDVGVEEKLGAQVQNSQGVIMAGKSSSPPAASPSSSRN